MHDALNYPAGPQLYGAYVNVQLRKYVVTIFTLNFVLEYAGSYL